MKLGFVVVNYHSDADTLSIISDVVSCEKVENVEVKIFAVDNSKSKDFESETKKFKEVVYIESKKGNIGFAAGNNLGIKRALKDGVDIICLINNDTQAPKDLVRRIIESPITQNAVGVVGGLIYFAPGFEYHDKYQKSDKGKVIWYAGGILDWNNVYGSHRGVDEVDKGQYSSIENTDFVTGCLFIVRANVLKNVGLLNEDYCLYHEDTDLNLRIKAAGYKLIIDPRIKIWHKVAQSSGIGSPLNDYFLTRNRLLLGMKYASLRTKLALLREAFRKLFAGTPTQKQAIRDFLFHRLGKGSFLK